MSHKYTRDQNPQHRDLLDLLFSAPTNDKNVYRGNRIAHPRIYNSKIILLYSWQHTSRFASRIRNGFDLARSAYIIARPRGSTRLIYDSHLRHAQGNSP